MPAEIADLKPELDTVKIDLDELKTVCSIISPPEEKPQEKPESKIVVTQAPKEKASLIDRLHEKKEFVKERDHQPLRRKLNPIAGKMNYEGMIRMEENEIMENEDNIIYLNPYTREDLLEMMQEAECSDDPEPSPPGFYFTKTDPYVQKPSLQDGHFCHNLRFDDEGHIVVKNLAAYWLPDICIEREIAGSVYTVTGSYEGTETLDNKLLRIMIRNMEGSE